MRLVDYAYLALASALVVGGIALVAIPLALVASGLIVAAAWYFIVDDA